MRDGTTTGSDAGRGNSAEADSAISLRLAGLLRVMLALGIVLVLAGSAMEFYRAHALPHSTTRISALMAGLASLDGQAVLTLGILVLLGTPALGLVLVLTGLLQAGARRYALVAAVVLGILLVSMFISIR